MSKVYGYVTDKIIEQLEKGVVPWRKPWISKPKINYKTRKPYRGINNILLDKPGEYLTFLQVKELGGRVKKDAKSSMVVFYKLIDKPNEETEELDGHDQKRFILRYYNVFHIDDCIGIESKLEAYDNEINADAESIYVQMPNPPQLSFEAGKACYIPSLDKVIVPPIGDYKNPDEYYSTLYHELMHSTGGKDRLNRKGIVEFDKFGSEQYSFEELVAEIGAAMLCSHIGLESPFENSAAYINGWLSKLKKDKKMIVKAANLSQKAVQYILNTDNGLAEEIEQ